MSVTAAAGFVAAGVHAGIRRDKLDLAVVRATQPATGAAMWTQNRVLAAPVIVSKQHLARAEPQAIVINSGVANAATGAQGEADARATAETAADLLGLSPEQVIVLSTGVIGAPLPVERIRQGLELAAPQLSVDGGADAATAILTTDTVAKTSLSRGEGFCVGGMAKGSGMIHPNLATMLAVVTTDYPLAPGEAIEFLRPAVAESFNAISVDGECSTNDAVVLLSSGAAQIERSPATDVSFALALRTVCRDLSSQIVTDGEGATLLAEINVAGAASSAEARAIAQRIATSPLVKTALFGRDANWGRVLMAAGSAPFEGGYAQVDATLVSLSYNGTAVLVAGAPQYTEPPVDGAVCTIDLDLGLGEGTRGLPDERSLLRLRSDQRGVPVVTRLVVKVGGAVAGDAAGRILGLAEEGHEVIVVHGAGPQITEEMRQRGIAVEFVQGRRRTSPAALEVVRESMEAVNAALCGELGDVAVPVFGHRDGLLAVPVPPLGPGRRSAAVPAAEGARCAGCRARAGRRAARGRAAQRERRRRCRGARARTRRAQPGLPHRCRRALRRRRNGRHDRRR